MNLEVAKTIYFNQTWQFEWQQRVTHIFIDKKWFTGVARTIVCYVKIHVTYDSVVFYYNHLIKG